MKRTKPKTKKVIPSQITKIIGRKPILNKDFNPDKPYTKDELEEFFTHQQLVFVREYINNGYNKVQAYLKAYPGKIQYAGAAANACGLLKQTKFQAYLTLMRDNLEELVNVSKSKQLREYMKIAYSEIQRYHKTWIELENYQEIKRRDPDCLTAIQSIETKTETKLGNDKELIQVNYVKITCHSKIAALQAIDSIMGYKATEKLSLTMEQPLFPDIKD